MGDTLENVGKVLEWFGNTMTYAYFPQVRCALTGKDPKECELPHDFPLRREESEETARQLKAIVASGIPITPFFPIVNPLFFTELKEAVNAIHSGALTKDQASELKNFAKEAMPLIEGAAQGILGSATVYAAKEVLRYVERNLPEEKSFFDYVFPTLLSNCGSDLPFWALGPVTMLSSMACKEFSQGDISAEDLGKELVKTSTLVLGSALLPGSLPLIHAAIKGVEGDPVIEGAKLLVGPLSDYLPF